MVIVLVMVIIGVGLVILLVRYQKCIKIKPVEKYVYIFCMKGGHHKIHANSVATEHISVG